MGVQGHLALCSKATLPILCMGHVRVTTKKHERKKPLITATRCLAKQPGGVSHLEVSSRDVYAYLDTRRHLDLRCAMLWYACPVVLQHALLPMALAVIAHETGTDVNIAVCFRSLLSNLCKLTFSRVAISLPALQLVATRLQELKVSGSRLQGSAEGFLTNGWTALTSLSVTQSRMDKTMLTAALKLPVLEDVHICSSTGYRDGELQLDQLTGSCPQIRRLKFKLGSRWRQFSQASRQRCNLLNLSRLSDLQVMSWSLQDTMDLDLPPSLTQLKFGGYPGGNCFDFIWALREAVECIGQGAPLHKLACCCARNLQPVLWSASLDEQHRRLGGQLGGLRELEVWGAGGQLLSAVGAVASAAPSLARLHIVITDPLPYVELPPICSASLESIRVEWGFYIRDGLPPPQVLLTFLPGCIRLQEVVVHFVSPPFVGASVKIRCHCCSRSCVVPADPCNKTPEEVYAGAVNDVVVNFVHLPSSEQDVQECTVVYAWHAAGPEQARLWGHTVMPGIQ